MSSPGVILSCVIAAEHEPEHIAPATIHGTFAKSIPADHSDANNDEDDGSGIGFASPVDEDFALQSLIKMSTIVPTQAENLAGSAMSPVGENFAARTPDVDVFAASIHFIGDDSDEESNGGADLATSSPAKSSASVRALPVLSSSNSTSFAVSSPESAPLREILAFHRKNESISSTTSVTSSLLTASTATSILDLDAEHEYKLATIAKSSRFFPDTLAIYDEIDRENQIIEGQSQMVLYEPNVTSNDEPSLTHGSFPDPAIVQTDETAYHYYTGHQCTPESDAYSRAQQEAQQAYEHATLVAEAAHTAMRSTRGDFGYVGIEREMRMKERERSSVKAFNEMMDTYIAESVPQTRSWAMLCAGK